MQQDNLDDLFNLPAIETQLGEVDKLIDRYLAKVAEASKASRISFDVKSIDTLEKLVTQSEKGAEATRKHAKALDELTAATKERERLQNLVVALQARLNNLENESGKALAETREQLRKYNAEARANAQVNAAAEGSLTQLRGQLRLLTQQYDGLSKAERENAAVGGMLVRQLLDVDKQVRAIEESTGRHQRSVGNYAKSWDGLSFSMMQLIRETPSLANGLNIYFSAIANNAPQAAEHIMQTIKLNRQLREEGKETVSIGRQLFSSVFNWQTGFIVVLTLLATYGSQIKRVFTGSSEAAEAAEKANKDFLKSLVDIDKQTRDSYSKEIAHLRTLNSVATNANATLYQRINAAKEMQKIWPTTLQNLSQEAILEGRAAAAINETANAIIARARARASENKLADASENVYNLDEQLGAARDNVEKYRKFLIRNVLEVGRAAKLNANITIDEIKEILDHSGADTDGVFTSEINKRQKAVSQLSKLRDEAVQVEEKYAKQVNATSQNINNNAVDIPAGSVADYRKQLEEVNSQINLAKVGTAELTALLKERDRIQKILDGVEKKPKAGRVKDTFREETYLNKQINDELIAANAAKAKAVIETDQHTQEAIYKNEKLSLEERKAALEQYHIDVLALIELEATAELEKNRVQHQATISRINHDIKSSTERNLLIQQENERFAAVNETIITKTNEAGKRSVEDYANSVVDMDDKATKVRLDNLDSLSEAFKDNSGTETLQQHLDKLKELMGYYQQFSDILMTINQIGANENQARLQALDEESELIRKQGEQELRNIDASNLSQQEKEQAKRQSEAKTAAQQEAIENKQRMLKYNQAVADKQANVAALIQRTALAVVTALTEGDPYTKLIRAGLAGALGAAQIAVASSTPIPKYAKGTGNSKHIGGPAMVGDGGKTEVVVDPAGNVSLTPNRPTIMDLAKGSMVFPSIQDFISRMPFMGTNMLGSISKQQDINVSVKAEFEASAQKIVDAINTKKQPAPVKLIGRDWGNYLTGNV